MKILQSIVYLILVAAFITAYFQGFDSYKNDALQCASYFDVNYGYHNDYYSRFNKYLYWQEDNICCRYVLENNMIVERCGDEK